MHSQLTSPAEAGGPTPYSVFDLASGQVVMERCSALDRRERAAGYVLACQAHPVTETVTLDFDR